MWVWVYVGGWADIQGEIGKTHAAFQNCTFRLLNMYAMV